MTWLAVPQDAKFFLVLTKVTSVPAFRGRVIRRRVAFPLDQVALAEELEDSTTRIRLLSGEEFQVEEALDSFLFSDDGN